MSKIAVFVEFTIHAGAFEKFYELMQKHAAASREEPGCLQFDICAPLEGENRLQLYELYEDRAAFDAHASTERIKQHRAGTRPLLADTRLVLCELRDSGRD